MTVIHRVSGIAECIISGLSRADRKGGNLGD